MLFACLPSPSLASSPIRLLGHAGEYSDTLLGFEPTSLGCLQKPAETSRLIDCLTTRVLAFLWETGVEGLLDHSLQVISKSCIYSSCKKNPGYFQFAVLQEQGLSTELTLNGAEGEPSSV